ncbi:DgyrCDS14390 [Dimorphilus gyrociliatus]|uniref:DgyrCDS14390 n=1 Tax=Dimorphilus gyrociliatus TaxID=2664684 RepID=A0A7I8WDF8_9ANNE|nr:DgyrCDS14390 [Dimorphilus gyrociliatus]
MGLFRKGKSFLMNLLYQSNNQGSYVENVFQVGFGDESVTKGIFMTKKPMVRTISGQRIYIFFLDSQGLFSSDLVRGDNLIVSFLFSLCPIVIYNADRRLTEQDINSIKFNIYLGVVDNEGFEKTQDNTIIFVLRNRPPQRNATFGKFDKRLKDSFMTGSESISQLSKLFGKYEFSPFPHPAAYHCSKDIGLEFIMAKDNLMKELDSLFNNYANDAISGRGIYKNIIHCYNSLMANDFIINEKSKDQLLQLVHCQEELQSVFYDFNYSLDKVFNLKYNYTELKKVNKVKHVLLAEYENYVNINVFNKSHLTELELSPLRKKCNEKLDSLFSIRYKAFVKMVERAEEQERKRIQLLEERRQWEEEQQRLWREERRKEQERMEFLRQAQLEIERAERQRSLEIRNAIRRRNELREKQRLQELDAQLKLEYLKRKQEEERERLLEEIEAMEERERIRIRRREELEEERCYNGKTKKSKRCAIQ